jgi:hypothetical protein
MSSYKKKYEQAKKGKYLKICTATFQEWNKPEELIVGKFISFNKVPSQRGLGEFNIYLFETDEGNVKFTLGAVTDAEVEKVLISGKVYAIVYKGQEDIAGGKRVNRFEVSEIIATPEKESLSPEQA